ncbi:MAG: hypothetical protein FJZ04_03980 [Candidatus Moranbacteria bacterium]|nr:hypothetical protein [Candidatus Moranbacteria bacterium]
MSCKLPLFTIFVFALSLAFALTVNAYPLSPDQGLFSPSSRMQGGGTGPNAPDQQQPPQSRQAQNQVPEKLDFVFQGHAYGMQSMGDHYVSDVQTLLRDVEYVNRNAWSQLYGKAVDEYLTYASPGTPATLASAPAGALAVGALDNAAAVGRQNVQFGIPFLFFGLGKQEGSDCQGTVRGMLEGNCKWGTPPMIENAVFANIIGDDVNLNQLGGAYEVWGVSPARSTLINLIFNQGLFR